METLYNILSYGGLALAIIFAIIAVILFITLHIPKAIGDLTGATARKQIQEIREKGYEGMQGGGVSKKDAIKAKDSTGRISVRDVKTVEYENRATEPIKPSKAVQERSQARYKQAIDDLQSAKTVSYDQVAEGSTDILGDEDYESSTDVLSDDYEASTDILDSGNEPEEATDILGSDENPEEATDILGADTDYEGSTDILTGDMDEASTDVLTAEELAEEATDVLSGAYDDISSDDDIFASDSGFTKIYDVVVVNTQENISAY